MKLFPALLLLSFAWNLAGAVSAAEPITFKEGISYVQVAPAESSLVKPGPIKVIEFFWYGCPHCFAFEPYIEAWLKHKPANVVFTRIPVAMNWGEDMDMDGHAFYVAQALGLEPKIHEPLFDAIHKDKHYMLVNDQDALQDFFSNYGVKKEQFDAAWNSFSVNLKMKQAQDIEQHYGLEGVPTVIIDGRWKTGAGYKVNDHYMAPAELIKCVKMLIKRVETSHKH